MSSMTQDESQTENMLGEIKSEDEKLQYALELAFNEISKDKNQDADAEGESPV